MSVGDQIDRTAARIAAASVCSPVTWLFRQARGSKSRHCKHKIAVALVCASIPTKSRSLSAVSSVLFFILNLAKLGIYQFILTERY